jgi:hypothetical protein
MQGRQLPKAPLILMSYLNPLLAFGFDKLAAAPRGRRLRLHHPGPAVRRR